MWDWIFKGSRQAESPLNGALVALSLILFILKAWDESHFRRLNSENLIFFLRDTLNFYYSERDLSQHDGLWLEESDARLDNRWSCFWLGRGLLPCGSRLLYAKMASQSNHSNPLGEPFFFVGLVSFLIGHIFYLAAFSSKFPDDPPLPWNFWACMTMSSLSNTSNFFLVFSSFDKYFAHLSSRFLCL